MRLALIALPIYLVVRVLASRLGWFEDWDFDKIRGLAFWACVAFIVLILAAGALGFGDEWDRTATAIQNRWENLWD